MRARLSGIAVVLATSLVAPAMADAPAGRYVVTETTVTDRWTGLTWQRSVILVDGGPVRTQEDAIRLCAAPFRLPTIKELSTLVDEAATLSPAIDATAFPGTPNLPYWSATRTNRPEQFRCYVMNPDGTVTDVYYNGSLFGGGVVRCVQ